MDTSVEAISFSTRGELEWSILYFGILQISSERKGYFLLQGVSKSNPLILLIDAQTIRIGRQIPGSRMSHLSLPDRGAACVLTKALDVASARSGLKSLISDHCSMSLAKSLCSLNASMKWRSRCLLDWTGMGVIWNDTDKRHQTSWHLRVSDKC